ncbi:hypothetical protein [Armatimonas rosea]|uniref:Uncharacterized protein n=1 Tax=Armatimonas rosea TaxID=685828 RepID=A0A7W9SVB7_ARMRO|nr:hypothetical protein [Armatimonas rosea]MBB6053525.1 hypothetical protein [Armatimonas rosea]
MKPTALLGLVALALLPQAVRAETVVGLGGETLFVFKADKDLDKTAQERSNDVYDRIRTILNNPRFKASDIQVKPLGDYGAKIVANGQLIVPIGNAEAEAHGSTHMALAEEWAKHLREVMPKLRARPDIFVQNNKYTKSMRRRSR